MQIQLNEPAEKLLAEIHQLYGRPITLVAKRRAKEFGGLSNILDDGTPYIQINTAGTDLPCVNWDVPVNRERSRDSAILVGVGIRKRAIWDVGLAGRDAMFGAAVNKKHAKTKDLNEKSRGIDLGFLR